MFFRSLLDVGGSFGRRVRNSRRRDADTKNTERTQFGAQHADFKEHLVVKADPISGHGSQAHNSPRQPACGRLPVEIRMDNGMTGIRASQPDLIVTDGRQIHGGAGRRNAA